MAEQQVSVQSEPRLVADAVTLSFPLTRVYLCHFTVVSPVPADHVALELQDGTKTFQPGSSCSAVSAIISALFAPSELPVPGLCMVCSRQRRLLRFLLHSAACRVPETEGTDVEHDVTGAGDEPLDR